LNVIGDEDVGSAVLVVVEPSGAGTEVRVGDAAGFRDVAELAIAFIVEEAVAFESGDVEIFPAVVVVVGDGYAHRVHLDVEAAAGRDVGERAVAVVLV
jgi:hypothetical protein